MRQSLILYNKTSGNVVDVLKVYLHSGSEYELRLRNEMKQTVADVKKMLDKPEVLYKENSPEFIQYLNKLTEDNIQKSKIKIRDTLIWKKLYKF